MPDLPRHPFRFGLQASEAVDRRSWVALARKVEDLGYSTLTVADHLDDQLATTPALMAAADATDSLRVGALVWCNDYHHPVVLAKEMATLDLLTEGRLELGLGAGWMVADYEGAGIPFDRAGVRVDRLTEAVEVIDRLLTSDRPVHHEGEHYRLAGQVGSPRPVQRPRPPLLIGGGGRRVLELAARRAEIVGLNIDLRSGRIDETAGPTATADATDEKLAWIREAAGDRFGQLELQVRIHLATITDDRRAVAEAVGPLLGLTPEQAMASPHALAGTVDEIVEQLEERRERFGISYIGISADAVDAMAPVVARLAGT
jgi:probable F420-dependent oxidoreductase